MTLLEANAIHVRFGDRVVLEEIDLAVEPGELHGVMGPNGAGKTTFFNVLTGRVRPSRGRIRLEGKDVTGLSPHAMARRGIARSFQIMTLFDAYTALENVTLALPAFRALGRAALEILAEVGLAEKADVAAKSLSYGERRALEIAVALAQAPRVLCLDEPTSGLGADGIVRLGQLIGRLKGRLAIVMIEHDMEFLFRLADRVSVVHWGQVIARGSPDELKQNTWVQRSNLGRLQ
jgi:branched-chain amino acid transport system ATP-binding protein